MTLVARLLRSVQRPRLKSQPLFTARTPAILHTDDLIEEQITPRYCAQHFYPVQLGEIFNDRYQVVFKLGFGTSSTVWLARDVQAWWWQSNPFVTLKILTNGVIGKKTANTELEISRCIARTDPKSEGGRYLRTVLNSFEVAGPDSTHVGLVYSPMREPVSTFQRRSSNGRLPAYLVKPLLEMLLAGLDHLHTKCHIIHTDLKPDNILLGIESQAAIDYAVNAEAESPTPRKIDGNRAIYASRNFGDYQSPPKRPKIADFGLAVWGNVSQPHNHPVQPDLFQAPEVILRAGWTYSADIWNLGVMLWDLLENRTLFDAFDPIKRAYSPNIHLLEMTSFLGPPPTELLKRGADTTHYFTAEGKSLQNDVKASNASTLEGCVTSLTGEDKRLFLMFVRRMLRWLPEDRATAAELIQDPWLTT